METVKGELLTENQQLMKSAIRGKIFQQSELMKDNLIQGTEFIYSKQHPTQVLDIKGSRYLRINDADIQEDTIDDLISLMLGIKDIRVEEDTEDSEFDPKEQAIQSSIDLNQSLEGEDLTESDLLEIDEYKNITNLDEVPIQPQYIKAATTEQEEAESKAEEEIKEDSSSCDMASDAKAMQSAMDSSSSDSVESAKAAKLEYQAQQELEQTLEEIESHREKSRFAQNESALSIDELRNLQKKVPMLLKAFKGKGGKVKKITPSKKICSKSMAMDKDKVYYSNKDNNGKHIKLNFLIDMSGSMYGEPVRNAVSIVWLFNQLAKAGYLKMNVLYSSSGYNYKLTLPATDAEILGLHNCTSSEGLADTIEEHRDCIANTNLICLTDGDIVDRGIPKTFWAKNKIISTGVYVNPAAKDVTQYSGNLNKWFNHSCVRQNLDDLLDFLIRVGLK